MHAPLKPHTVTTGESFITKPVSLSEALDSAIAEDTGLPTDEGTSLLNTDDTPPLAVAADDAGDIAADAGTDAAAETGQGPTKDPLTGKFTSKSKTQAPDAAAAPGTPGPTDAAPATLNKEAAALWPTLPPVVKAEMTRLSKEGATAVQAAKREMADYKRDREAIDPVLKPFDDLCKQKGLHTPQMLHSYIEWSKLAETNPQQFLSAYCQRMGINLQQMLNAPADQDLDPVVRTVQQQMQQVQQRLDTFVGGQQQREQQQTMNVLASFRDATDASGTPLRPHYDRVLPMMNQLYGAARQRMPHATHDQVLQSTYDMACRADPELYREIKQAEFQTDQQQNTQAAMARTAKARGAAVSPAGAAAPTGGDAMRGKSIKELLEIQMANADRIS